MKKKNLLVIPLFLTALTIIANGQAAPQTLPTTPPVAMPAPDAPPSGTGTPEATRIQEDTKRLQQRLTDWAALAFYYEENQKLPPSSAGENRVVFMGDSITHNWGSKKYSTLFAEKPYINRGIGGQTTGQMVLRFRQDVLALHPRVVVILAGTNDLATYKVPDLLQFTEDNLASMVELAQLHGIRVVLCSLLPVSDVYKLQTDRRQPEKILTLNTWIRNYAAKVSVPYVDYYSAVVDDKGFFKTELTVDGLHPSAAGFDRMRVLVEQAIQRALVASSN